MSFVRPELRATLWRWREAIFSAALGAGALWLMTLGGLLLLVIGALGLAVAAGLGVQAVRRVLFSPAGEGPGIVQVDEARIRYFGPFYGGAVSLDQLVRIENSKTADGRGFWHLHHSEGEPLVIPADAAGAEQLFDAFCALPGMDMGRLMRAGRPAAGASPTDPGKGVVPRRPGNGILARPRRPVAAEPVWVRPGIKVLTR